MSVAPFSYPSLSPGNLSQDFNKPKWGHIAAFELTHTHTQTHFFGIPLRIRMAHQCNQLGLGHLAELHTCQRAARGGHGQGED